MANSLLSYTTAWYHNSAFIDSEIVSNETDCNLNSFLGKIICVSDQSGRTGAKVEDTLYLTTNEVKAKAIEIYSESDMRHVLEEIPRLSKFKSSVITDVGK